MTVPALLPAYILHSRPYQENKLLLQLLLPEHGRLSAIVRKSRGRQRQPLQPFQLLSVQLAGRSALKTVLQLEEQAPAPVFTGKVLFSALYLNELICRLWPDDLATEALFGCYQQSLQQLKQVQLQQDELEPCLRQFEFSLLQELGLQVDWQHDSAGNPLLPGYAYQWQTEQGFIPATKGWNGEQLIAIGQHDWQLAATRLAAKQLSRQLLAPLLGNKPLSSRALFEQLGQDTA